MQKRINWWWIGVGILWLVLIIVGVIYFSYNRMVVKPNKPKSELTPVLPTATPTPDPLAPYSILLLGYGGGKHEGGLLTDSIMLAEIIPHEEEVRLISIPRDLWVPILVNGDEIQNKKMNEAYAIGFDDKKYPNKKIEFTGSGGGGEMAKYAVEQVTGIKPNYFAAIDFDGFIKIIDSVGGIEVKVVRTFEDPYYPIEENINDLCGKSEEEVKALEATMSGDKLDQQFTCRYENLHFDKGTQYMNGITALKFARSRHSNMDGGDFGRSERQKLVISAIRDKVMKIGFIPKIVPTVQTLTKHITTDIDFAKMSELITKIPDIAEYKIISIALTDQNGLKNAKASTGQFILNPKAGENNFDEIKEFIKNNGVIITQPTATPTSSLKN